MTHVFEVEVAEEYGVNAAIVLNLLRTWIAYNRANKKNERDGRTWTYNSVMSWSKLLPYLTPKQVRTALDILLAAGLVVKCNFNEKGYDQTLWYALTDETAPPCPTGQKEKPEGASPMAQEGKSLDQVSNQSKDPSGERKKEDELSLEAIRFVAWFVALLVETGAREPVLTDAIRANWADCYEKMIRLDGRSKKEVASVCRWARSDDFWSGNFLSPMKLRQKNSGGVMYYDFFLHRMEHPNNAPNQRSNGRSVEQRQSYVGVENV